jgi:hypothetical protein
LIISTQLFKLSRFIVFPLANHEFHVSHSSMLF